MVLYSLAFVGGFDLAVQWMGWDNVFQVEWDGWCRKILAKNFPDTLRFGDIVEFNKMLQDGKIITDTKGNRRKIDRNEKQKTEDRDRQIGIYEKNITKRRKMGSEFGGYGYNRPTEDRGLCIDIITGGFPCQPFSHAGKRKGTDDSRYLWPEMLTTIRILKPSFVIGENVAGLVSMENGKTLDRILSDLANEGYTTEQFIIPACAIGAWHRRDRIWIICYTTKQGLQKSETDKFRKSLPNAERTSLQRDVPDTISRRQQRQGESFNAINTEKAEIKQAIKFRNDRTSDIWSIESRLGRVVNGLPDWLHEPDGVPRVATGIKNRTDRLKGLGNAIVPQVAYELFKAIEQYDHSPERHID